MAKEDYLSWVDVDGVINILLIDSGAEDVEKRNKKAEMKKLKCAIDVVISAGKDVIGTLFFAATKSNEKKIAQNLLLTYGAEALILAAGNGYLDVVKLLIAAGADVNAKPDDCETALTWAARCEHTEILKTLIAAGADLNLKNSKGNTALMFAAVDGSAEVVKHLIAAGADVNIKNNDGDTALTLAEKWKCKEIVKIFKTTKE